MHKFRWLALPLLSLLFVGCGQSPEELDFDSAWVRPPLPSKTTTSAYVELNNRTKQTITLTSADSTTIGAIEFHKSVLEDGMHRMLKLDKLEIPAKDSLSLEPGGLHLMLFRIQTVEENEHVINFHTEEGDTYEATFKVRDEDSS